MISHRFVFLIAVCFACCVFFHDRRIVYADDVIEVGGDQMIHLRIDGDREWSSFPEMPEAALLEREFDSVENTQS